MGKALGFASEAWRLRNLLLTYSAILGKLFTHSEFWFPHLEKLVDNNNYYFSLIGLI